MTEISSGENATSDVEEIELYPEPECNGKRILRENQSDVTVASEVLRGIKLRERKPPPSQRKDRCPVIINLPKPYNVRKRKARKVLSNSCPGCSHWTIPQCSKSMMAMATSTKNKRLKFRIKAAKQTICPMRIAELAVPTKRHCIDTWRNKSYLLPESMVERLKQHVLDQRPVVEIPEAVFCFQKRKPRLHKKRSAKDTLSYWKKEMEKPLCDQNTRTICLIFAQKIVQRLLTPLKITINSDLENIARVIVSDIVRITKGKKYMTTSYLQKYRSVHADTINKITVWIVGILEDLTYKQLEEDLRDLEEEEGPVLDFIDDLLENVFDICVPKIPEVYNEEESEESEESEKSSSSDSLVREHSDNELSHTEYFKNEISNLINNFIVEVIDDNQIETVEAINDISDKDDLLTEINVILKNILKESVASNDTINDDNNIVTDIEYFENEIINLISNVYKESEDNIENISNIAIFSLEDSIEDAQLTKTHNSETDLKGSVDMLSEDTDDRSKKVMFSVSDIVTPSDAVLSSELTGMPSAPKESMNFYNIYLKHNILFAEPNENLLSDADELWPSHNFSHAVLRPSTSVTKSIPSLGKLPEDDEKDFILESINDNKLIDSSIDEQENIHTAFINNEIKQLFTSPVTLTESANSEERYIKTSLVKSNEKLIVLKDSASLIETLQRDEKILTAEEIKMFTNYNLTVLDKDVQVNTDCRDNESMTDEVKTPNVNLGTSRTIIVSVDPEPMQHKLDSKNIIYSLKKETLTTSKNKGTVTDRFEKKLTPGGQLTESLKLTQSDIHKWCYDLDKGFKNLEIWQDWLHNTCKEATDLLQKKNHTCLTRNYMKLRQKLKNNVDEDAVLWRKINQNTHERFKCYRKYYEKKKIGQPNFNARCCCKINARRTT